MDRQQRWVTCSARCPGLSCLDCLHFWSSALLPQILPSRLLELLGKLSRNSSEKLCLPPPQPRFFFFSSLSYCQLKLFWEKWVWLLDTLIRLEPGWIRGDPTLGLEAASVSAPGGCSGRLGSRPKSEGRHERSLCCVPGARSHESLTTPATAQPGRNHAPWCAGWTDPTGSSRWCRAYGSARPVIFRFQLNLFQVLYFPKCFRISTSIGP